MSSNNPNKNPIVFVHGLWLHGESWNKWREFFRANGYDAVAASWPGDSESTMATRKNANAVAGYGVGEIADHIAGQFKAQPSPLIPPLSRVYPNCLYPP